VVRDRLRENDLANTQCILALGNMIEQRWASEWWEDFSQDGREEFEGSPGTSSGRRGGCYLACHRGGVASL
jgi:hypothetical protein